MEIRHVSSGEWIWADVSGPPAFTSITKFWPPQGYGSQVLHRSEGPNCILPVQRWRPGSAASYRSQAPWQGMFWDVLRIAQVAAYTIKQILQSDLQLASSARINVSALLQASSCPVSPELPCFCTQNLGAAIALHRFKRAGGKTSGWNTESKATNTCSPQSLKSTAATTTTTNTTTTTTTAEQQENKDKDRRNHNSIPKSISRHFCTFLIFSRSTCYAATTQFEQIAPCQVPSHP